MSAGRKFDSLTETADRLGVNERTVRRWVSEGRLTAFRLGPRMLRFDPEQVDRSLFREVPTAAQPAAGGRDVT
ncbi:MAG: helix-turn-helix domain-containing protein [Propionibacteriales bacterium]|nr:helix-turn-helix domain-containing protein [Propionibacteriales bacterium]